MTRLTRSEPTSRALTRDEADALGGELDALRQEVMADLGERDVAHLRAVMRASNGSAILGRTLLHFGIDPLTFVVGSSALALAKILENMEIGHNVMHGQYEWTGDPWLRSERYEWDIVCDGDDWRHSHNYEHHTFTNILGKDRDIGYAFLRVADEQPWEPRNLVQPLTALGLAVFFQWGVAMHDLRFAETSRGEGSWSELARRSKPFLAKAAWQVAKDYVFFPALAGPNAPRVALGNASANVIRNLWAFAVIFCGHFPEGVRVYTEEETRDESRGQWYVRQINGSANLEGGRWMHLLTGHLSHQIEHHLFPDVPASRYPEMAPHVRAICERYGQVYRSGPFRRQLGSVAGRIVKLSVPKLRRALPRTEDAPASLAA
ncbi:MAG: acyl-CoA desaturase [Sandaracinus sp.]|nr:acyl-CoA desaturase [Sandaracinus sp.]MCB9604691.1 acyl-CoA desaturase [Sandaracinus sp.]MCB9613443.1 acyl-CoA desaturase [Sandaracinus sp.]